MKRLKLEILKQLYWYHPDTGFFTRLVKRGKYQVNEIAGYLNSDGYVLIEVGGCAYRASNLAWVYMTGEWPENEIDHKDTNCSNNAWINLRPANRSENVRNRRGWGESGIKGVRRKGYRFEARIRVDGTLMYLGRFGTEDEAKSAYNRAALKFFKEYAKPNK